MGVAVAGKATGIGGEVEGNVKGNGRECLFHTSKIGGFKAGRCARPIPPRTYTATVSALGFAASNCLSTYCKIPPLA